MTKLWTTFIITSRSSLSTSCIVRDFTVVIAIPITNASSNADITSNGAGISTSKNGDRPPSEGSSISVRSCVPASNVG